MSVRDRYDTGKADKQTRLQEWVREGTQQHCAVNTIMNAQEAVHTGTAGALAVDLLATLAMVKAEELGARATRQ